MKTKRFFPVLLACLGFVATTAFPADDAAKTYDQLKKQIEDVAKNANKYGTQLNKTLESLNAMSNVNAKNVQKVSKDFQKDVESLQKELKNTTEKIKDLQQKRATYFAAWEKSVAGIADPDLKKVAGERRQKVMDAHAKVSDDATKLRGRIDEFMSQLGDLGKFLGSDPTADAISAAKPSIERVLSAGRAVSADVQKVVQTLNGFAKGQA